MNAVVKNKVKIVFKLIVITISFVPFCLIVCSCFMTLIYLSYKESKDLEFIKNYRVNAQSIDDKIEKMKEVQTHHWEASEFNVSCDLILKNSIEIITFYFVKEGKTVYAASRRTADVFPELPNTNNILLSYDTFAAKR